MTIIHGRNAGIYINGVDLSGDVNAVTVNSEQELADVTVFGHVGHTLYPGLAKDTGTIEALFNSTSAAVFNAMLQIDPSYGMMVVFGGSTGDPSYSVKEVMLNNHSIKSVVSDVNRVSFAFDVDNWPFEPGVLLTSGKQTIATNSTGAGTIIDNGSASGTTGGAGYMQVFDWGDTGLQVYIKTSSTGAFAGEEATLLQFTNATSTGAERKAYTTQAKRYARVNWNNLGTAGVVAVSLVRY